MSRNSLTIMLLILLALNTVTQAATPKRAANARRVTSSASTVLPRLQRDPRGRVRGQQWHRQAQAHRQRANTPPQAAQRSLQANSRRMGGSFTADAWKRGGQRLNQPIVRHNASPPRAQAANPRRMAGQFSQNAWKRGAGRFPATQPGSKPRMPRSGRVAASSSGKILKRAGAAGAVVGGVGLLTGAASRNGQLQADLRAGRISQVDFQRAQATDAVNIAGGALAIKKLNPTTAAMNAAIGTDPISLGVDIAGDLINGTNNASKSLQNVGKTLEGHAHGVQKLATDPAGWAKDAGRDIEQTAKGIGKAVGNTAQGVGKFVDGVFGGKKKK